MSHETRRTFAIISHPDAGKTTLTEKLLLFGGAINTAGQVKARKNGRSARSDWMNIEQERGISVTTSVMTFEHENTIFNLLDTPGHEDFSEDTYRTLTAVDSAVMVIDASKGIESMTRKLFEVCRLRDIPIITFVNKMDRESRDPFDLLDEIQDTLALETSPVTWPVGMGADFRGCYDVHNDRMIVLEENIKARLPRTVECKGLNDPLLETCMTPNQRVRLEEEVNLVREACAPLKMQAFRDGYLTPVYFGSGLRNFGIRELIDGLLTFAPPPRPQPSNPRTVSPEEGKVSGFVFKVQANMDLNHRDRIAFLRLCSGVFRRGMKMYNVRTGKHMSIQNPVFFFSRGRESADEAAAGDIIGIPNHGTLSVGDTLTEGEPLYFTGIPNFAPEILRRVVLKDKLKSKHLKRALESLAEEGVTQVFRSLSGTDWIVGVVGALQLDVLENRLMAEYGLEIGFEATNFHTARWISSDDRKAIEKFVASYKNFVAMDKNEEYVFLPRSEWVLNNCREEWPDLKFSSVRERGFRLDL